ncbi:GNAT family N-acetyltransferase [Flaviaesturariibacter amylovorans]|uniref:GNAT family N-acetyltransferase n=1 Tax=Flaviaesturariibacter amylovorans TaxID=1084520 RepID=A0ABP8GLQ6_9BACT
MKIPQPPADVHIRSIAPADNAALAGVIRRTLEEFGAARPGTVYYDESTDHLYELFRAPRSAYFVAEQEGRVVGGGGIYPTEGLPDGTCELVKMYLLPEARGIGLGSHLIRTCIAWAESAGYTQVYLETMPELKKAMSTYERLGFRYLNGPMGNSGHHGCELWMLKQLSPR